VRSAPTRARSCPHRPRGRTTPGRRHRGSWPILLFQYRINHIRSTVFRLRFSINTVGSSDPKPRRRPTMKILQINASARVEGSNSTRLADAITAKLVAAHPDAIVEVHDLARDPHPMLDEAALGALFTAPAERSPEQAARVALDDAVIAQLQSADAVVLGVPMYNFGTPVQLKAWIDAIARAGVTFRYTESGPQGLVTGKKVYVALARGG